MLERQKTLPDLDVWLGHTKELTADEVEQNRRSLDELNQTLPKPRRS